MSNINKTELTEKLEIQPELPIDVRSTEACLVLFDKADLLLEETRGDIQLLLNIEESMFNNGNALMEHLIVKAAISKQRILDIGQPLFLDVVVPAYHEVIRMSPRSSSRNQVLYNPLTPNINGEDALLRKYIELEWLTRGTKLEYKLRVVDDICDHGSGHIANQLIQANNLWDKISVHFLDRAVKDTRPGTLQYLAIETIVEKGESIRGGALCLGFAEAIMQAEKEQRASNTIVSYVDADSSYSLTQVGIPLWELYTSPNTQAVTASRQSKLTYMDPPKETSQTSGRSPGLIRLKQVVGFLRQTVLEDNVPADTQSGFKFFRLEAIKHIITQPNKAGNFSFDTQLLSRIARHYPQPDALKTFGVVLIDCDELTTANNGSTYFYASKIVAEIADEIGFKHNTSEMYLLKYLTLNIGNYDFVIKILEDSTNIEEWFEANSPEYDLLVSIRQRIQTNRDTTAVGEYFTSSICDDLVKIIRLISKNL